VGKGKSFRTRRVIPPDVCLHAEEAVARFNERRLDGTGVEYLARVQGAYLYLDRCDHGRTGRICRLKYTGALDGWEFAIFKYSSDLYDPDEWMFPGASAVDGTIEGAMIAGLDAYPA